jgi:hypothetical protein
LPQHLYEEHPLDQSYVRLNASKKAFYRGQQRVVRPENAANYFNSDPDPG